MKLNKIFIVGLFLLAIIAMGAVSASEDITDDTVTAIEPTDEAIDQAVEQTEPTDEAIDQAVEQTEPTDEAISQAVEQTEPTEEVISESADDVEIEESTDSNEKLSDSDDFYISAYNGYLESFNVYINSHIDRSGIIKIYVDNGLKIENELTDGKFNGETTDKYFYPSDLGITEAGIYTIKFTFTENGEETVLRTSQVNLTNRPDFYISIYNVYPDSSSDSTAIYFTSYTEKSGTIKIYVNNKAKEELTIVNGKFNSNSYYYIRHSDLEDLGITELGTYDITITFTEDGTQTEEVMKTGQIAYTDFKVDFEENVDELYSPLVYIYSHIQGDGTINIYVNDNLKLNLSVEEGYFNYNGYNGGYVSVQTRELIRANGLYKIKVTFKENGSDNERTLAEKDVSLVRPDFDYMTSTLGLNENVALYIKFPNVKSGNVTINEYAYDDDTYEVKLVKTWGTGKIVNGKVMVEISGLVLNDSHHLLIEYSTNLGNGNQTFEFNLIKNTGNASASAPSVIAEGTNPAITFQTSKVGTLYISVDGQIMIFEEVSSLKYIIPDLAVGTHYVRVFFLCDYLGSDSQTNMQFYDVALIKSFKITVKPKVIITASKVSATYNSAAKTLSVTLKDANKKVLAKKAITVTLNGKTYKATTNSKGIAKIKVPAKLVPKTYTATIKFAGDAKYAAASLKAKVVVNKAKVKLTAKATSFKVKATKKFTATLKDNKGKVMKSTKLTLKVGAKTYTAKTNAKGVATFKVQLTKKGAYSATVKFAGNKYFKATSQKVKITVK